MARKKKPAARKPKTNRRTVFIRVVAVVVALLMVGSTLAVLLTV